jgi:uncharacterized protein YggU (UPF0235/DUF167 family)
MTLAVTMRFDWGMTVLDLLLILEGLILLVAGIFWAVGESVGRNNPKDTLKLTMRMFWSEILRKPGGQTQALLEVGPSEVEVEMGRYAEKQQKKADAQKAGAASTGTLNVKVVAGADVNQIAGKSGDEINIQVTAPAEGGEANKVVIDLLADALGIQGYRIKLVRGHYQARKSLQISGLSSDEVMDKLDKFC